MGVKCNMTEQERDHYLYLFPDHRSGGELEKARDGFKRYLFYDTWGRRDFREYYCPYCGRFEIERPYRDVYVFDPFSYHHNDETNCPLCQMELTLICLGRMRNMNSLEQWGRLVFLRAEGETLTISAGTARRRFDPEDLDPWPEYFESTRYVIGPGLRQGWRRQTIWEGCHPVGHQWIPARTIGEPFQFNYYSSSDGAGYIVGGENIEKTDMRYCQIEDFAWEVWNVDLLERDGYRAPPVRGLVTYLAEYSRRPQIEMLVKLGYTEVVQKLLEDGALPKSLVNWKAKTPAAFFRMSKAEFRAFRETGAGYNDLAEFQNRGPMAEEMDFREYIQAREYLYREADHFFALCERWAIPARQAVRYIHEQAPEGASGAGTYTTWADYISMESKLMRDMTFNRNRFPEDLRREHDAATALVKKMQTEETKKKYGQRFRWLKRKYAFSDGELQIVVPMNEEDIRKEGHALAHCVGGYAPRHVQGATTILFLRRVEEPEKRYVTIEINDETNQIRQAHGYKNERDGAEPPRVRHREFFDEWLDWLRRGSPRARNGKPIRKQKKQEAKTA